MNRFKQSKKVGLILKSLGVSTLLGTTAFLSFGFAKTQQLANITNAPINKSLNEVNTQGLTNPKYIFSNFSFLNATNETNFNAPFDLTAIKQWETIQQNLKAKEINPFSSTPSYQAIKTIVDNLVKSKRNLIVKQSLINAPNGEGEKIWNSIKAGLEYKTFDEIVGKPQDLELNLRKLSGFVSGDSSNYKIKTLSNLSVNFVDLSKDNGKFISPIPPLTNTYKTVIKIAEFDKKNITSTIKIDFNYASSLGGLLSRGSLIIRNLNNKPNLESNLKELEIFGRWQLPSSSITISPVNKEFPSVFPNFVLSEDSASGKISIFARLKDNGEFLNNVVVDQGHTVLNNFGIIDSQIDDTHPLFDEKNKKTVVSDIQFFSSTLKQSPSNVADASPSVNKEINSKFEYYLGSDTNFALNLFYKIKNKDGSHIYKGIPAFVNNEESTNFKQFLKLGIDDKGDQISLDTTKIELSDNVINAIIKNNYTSTTTAEYIASVASVVEKTFNNSNPIPNIFKQQILFNDFINAFSIIGSPIDIANNQMGIRLNDLTQKIFPEKPNNFIESSTSTFSEAKSSQWKNQDTKVISELATIYEKWAKQEGAASSKPLGLEVYNKINSSKDGNKYKNITWESQSYNYTGHELYNALVDEYDKYQKILSQLIVGYKMPPNIFSYPTNNASTIIKEQLLINNNGSVSDEIIKKVASIINKNPTDKDFQIGKQLARLINIKFAEMKSTVLDNNINTFYYGEIKKYLDSSITGKLFNSSANFLEFNSEDSLFKITNKNVFKPNKKVKGSEMMASLFELLYFGQKDLYFGTSIFSAISTSGGNNSTLKLFNNNESDKYQLSHFTSTTTQSIDSSIKIYDRLLSTFNFGIYDITAKSLITGETLKLKWGEKNMEDVVTNIFNRFENKQEVIILQHPYEYNLFNSLVTSANIYNSLFYRFNNTPKGVVSIQKDQEKITKILNSGIVSPEVIFTWSRVQIMKSIVEYVDAFSSDTDQAKRLSNEIKTEPLILDKVIKEQEALFNSNFLVDMAIVWPIIIGLIAVGMIVVSSISVVGIRKTSKLSSKKVLTTILFIIMVVSVALIGVSIFGFLI